MTRDTEGPVLEPEGAKSARGGKLMPGEVIQNTYRIEERIGRGGMGEVYRATVLPSAGEHQVAIKVISAFGLDENTADRLFRREADALRKLRHPAIIGFEGVQRDQTDRIYLVMEYVDGPSLRALATKEPLSTSEILRLGRMVADGLAAAHDAGIVHRDISPDNVLLRGGRLDRPVVIDFGLAKQQDGSTIIGSGFAGKLDYCSPEQCGLFGGKIDGRTDIYSLGLTLAAAAAGRPIPMGASLAQAVAVRQKEPDLSSLPADLRKILRPLLQPDPSKRPSSMRALFTLGPLRAGRRRWPVVAGLAALVVAGSAVVAAQIPSLSPYVPDLLGVISGHDRVWKQADHTDTVLAYQGYIASYPSGRHVDEARRRILRLQEAESWEQAVRSNTLRAHRVYIANYPQGPNVSAARRRIAAFEQQAWAEAERLKTLAGYEAYLIDHDDGPNGSAARGRISMIQAEQKAWAEAEVLDTLEGYRIYLSRFALGANETAARLRISAFERQAWSRAEGRHTFDGYQAYLADHHDGPNAPTARQRLAAIEAERKAWAEAEALNTPEGYRIYLSQFARGTSEPIARQRITAFERQAWAAAERRNTLDGYQAYLRDHHDGPNAPMARQRIAALEPERQAWAEAEASGTLRGYRAYLAQYRQGANVATARARIAAVERQAWAEAERVKTLAGFRAYLADHDDGINASIALQRIAMLDRQAWAQAERLNSVDGYKAYLSEFGQGENAAEALRRIEAEARAWERAKNAHTIQAYLAYLEQFGAGLHADEAKEAITRLRSIVVHACPPPNRIYTSLTDRGEPRVHVSGLAQGPLKCGFLTTARSRGDFTSIGAFMVASVESPRWSDFLTAFLGKLWPLEVGKEARETYEGLGPGGKMGGWTYAVRVERREAITVPAGTFDTLLVSLNISGQSVDRERIDQRLTYWYAPSIQWNVRIKTENLMPAMEQVSDTRELQSMHEPVPHACPSIGTTIVSSSSGKAKETTVTGEDTRWQACSVRDRVDGDSSDDFVVGAIFTYKPDFVPWSHAMRAVTQQLWPLAVGKQTAAVPFEGLAPLGGAGESGRWTFTARTAEWRVVKVGAIHYPALLIELLTVRMDGAGAKARNRYLYVPEFRWVAATDVAEERAGAWEVVYSHAMESIRQPSGGGR